MQNSKTIIIGGGMAGMSCALKLIEAGEEFLLISEDLGGRIKYSPAARVNYGAYFVMAGYVHAKRLVSPGTWINPLDSCFHNGVNERYRAVSWHTLTQLPGFVRFYLALREFMKHYALYKQRCLTISQREALQADPYLSELYAKPASVFVKEQNIKRVSDEYISKFAYACSGANLDQLSALDFLNVSQGMVTPIHTLIFEPERVAARLGDHLMADTITAVEASDAGYTLNAVSGRTYQAQNVVIATPAAVTQKLLGLKEIRQASSIFVYHIRGELKAIYRSASMNLFPSSAEFMLTVKQQDGSYLVYARKKPVDLNQVCEHYELLAAVEWEKAMYVQGEAFIEQQVTPGLFVAGDHNGLGLEPAAISGIYAANQILQGKRS